MGLHATMLQAYKNARHYSFEALNERAMYADCNDRQQANPIIQHNTIACYIHAPLYAYEQGLTLR